MNKALQTFTYYAIFFMILAVFTYFVTSFAKGPNLENYATITISAGDTLWELGQKYREQHHLSSHEFVEWVETENHLEYKTIMPGEKIYIPILKKDFQEGQMLASN
ncbi:cell division suppressor protein YneA [Bacillus songklensis]|uniref:Cell division suppressor protein YneA n=1 Tax=Bacillus songklensis TaxID=1069116 RepID=A0ABV8AWC5_9BACI